MKYEMILILCIAMILAGVLCLAAFAAGESGMTFTAYDAYEMGEAFTAPRTYEAWIKIPTDWNSDGVIAGNWHGYGFGLDFEVQSNGTPRVVYFRKALGGSKATHSIVFSEVDLRTDTWTFLAITESSDHVDCYVNGVLAQTVNTTVTKRVCTFPLTINGDNFCLGNPYWFRGALRSIAFYKDYRTAEEIAADMTAPDTGDANLIAAYTFNGTPTATIPDLAGN
ncbi:MAG: LamG domain-containing protein, partial [Clostridia bacterium]|nr:LamG domain-containing protein [Clostridia bacterium]